MNVLATSTSWKRREVDPVGARCRRVNEPQLACGARHLGGETAPDEHVGVAQLLVGNTADVPVDIGPWRDHGFEAFAVRRHFGPMTTVFTSASVQGRALAVERPAGDQILHRDGVVAAAQALTLVQLVCGGQGSS